MGEEGIQESAQHTSLQNTSVQGEGVHVHQESNVIIENRIEK